MWYWGGGGHNFRKDTGLAMAVVCVCLCVWGGGVSSGLVASICGIGGVGGGVVRGGVW